MGEDGTVVATCPVWPKLSQAAVKKQLLHLGVGLGFLQPPGLQDLLDVGEGVSHGAKIADWIDLGGFEKLRGLGFALYGMWGFYRRKLPVLWLHIYAITTLPIPIGTV